MNTGRLGGLDLGGGDDGGELRLERCAADEESVNIGTAGEVLAVLAVDGAWRVNSGLVMWALRATDLHR